MNKLNSKIFIFDKEIIPINWKVHTDGAVSVTVQQWKIALIDDPYVFASLGCSDSIIALFQLLSSFTPLQRLNCCLSLNYVPFARQDRPTGNEESTTLFSLKTFADIINGYNLKCVRVCDPHSDVVPALFNNSSIQYIPCLLDLTKYDCLVTADAGGYKRVHHFNKSCAKNNLLTVISATKVRDVLTNEITQTAVSESVKGLRCLIVDDLIDGGRTFSELAKVLKLKGAITVDLYVTYGIFSYGVDSLKDYLDHIYCYQSWKHDLGDFVTCFNYLDET